MDEGEIAFGSSVTVEDGSTIGFGVFVLVIEGVNVEGAVCSAVGDIPLGKVEDGRSMQPERIHAKKRIRA